MQGESDVGGVGDRDCSELGLLKHHEVPVWMQHAGILTGYRQPQKTLRACATTIFSLHNESINIWTHLLAAAWMLWVFFDIAWTKLHRSDIVVEFAMGAMILSAACAYLGSVAFHTRRSTPNKDVHHQEGSVEAQLSILIVHVWNPCSIAHSGRDCGCAAPSAISAVARARVGNQYLRVYVLLLKVAREQVSWKGMCFKIPLIFHPGRSPAHQFVLASTTV